jgi:YggT family protein
MKSVLDVVMIVLNIYWWVVIAAVILSWLIQFNVINMRNEFAAMVANTVWRLTEPVLAPLRRRLPNLGGLDLSPLVLLLGIFFLQSIIVRYGYPNVF